jgi:hypothetical protein
MKIDSKLLILCKGLVGNALRGSKSSGLSRRGVNWQNSHRNVNMNMNMDTDIGTELDIDIVCIHVHFHVSVPFLGRVCAWSCLYPSSRSCSCFHVHVHV